jgi:hypothetical protein
MTRLALACALLAGCSMAAGSIVTVHTAPDGTLLAETSDDCAGLATLDFEITATETIIAEPWPFEGIDPGPYERITAPLAYPGDWRVTLTSPRAPLSRQPVLIARTTGVPALLTLDRQPEATVWTDSGDEVPADLRWAGQVWIPEPASLAIAGMVGPALLLVRRRSR